MTLDQAEFREKLPESAWHFLLPSVRDIIFIFLFCSLLAGTLSDRPLADPDIGWHIRTGERILAAHALPRTDPYSSTMHGQPWFAWEWLYDLVLGILHHACGLNGVVWLCALLVATVFTLLLSELLQQGTGLLLAILLMLLAEAAAMIHLFARPHIVSWLFVLLWFIALEKWEGDESRRADANASPNARAKQPPPRWLPWFFPASMLLWVNLHGEWLFGLALLAIYALASLVASILTHDDFVAIRAAHRGLAMARAWVISALATFVNPFGWRLHQHIYLYLSDRFLMSRIAEFRSPDFHGWAQRCFGIILLLVLLSFSGHRRNTRLSHLLVVLLAVYAGLFSSRNLPVASMLLVLIAGPNLWENFVALAAKPFASQWLRRTGLKIVGFSTRMEAQELQLRGHIWPVACAVGALALCLQGGWLGSRQLLRVRFDPKKVPVAAVDYLAQEAATQPVFSTDSWGGYLIYRLYPRRQVVVDDRHDLYGSGRVRELLILMQGEPGWQGLLAKWQVQTILLPRGSTLASLLREVPGDWRVAYEDKVAVVFEKN